MGKIKYKVKVSNDTKVSKSTAHKNEVVLRDLLTVIPTLRKHKLEAEVRGKINKLRSGRKIKSYSLELSRPFNGKEIVVSAPIKSSDDKIATLRHLKQEIREQIKKARLEQRPPVEDFTFSQGVKVKKLAEVYLEPNSFVKVMEKKIRLDMTKGKKPTTADRYIGVEIELASKKSRDFICDALFEAGVGKHVTAKGDGSIKTDAAYPQSHELNILVRESEYEQVITKICKVLNEQCEVRVDASCGLHVHLDMRGRDVKTCFNNMVLSQQFLYAMLPANRRSSRYSYPLKGAQWRDGLDRYHGVNAQAYAKYQTLEARMHSGTTQANKIINWVKLLISIVNAPKFAYAPTVLEEFQDMCGFDNDVLNYCKKRIAKFEEQHKKAKYTAEEPGTMPTIAPVSAAPTDDSVAEQSEVA